MTKSTKQKKKNNPGRASGAGQRSGQKRPGAFRRLWQSAARRKKGDHLLSSRQVLILVVIFCGALIGLSLVSHTEFKPLKIAADCTIVPVEKGFSKVGSWLNGRTADIQTLQEVQEENEALKEEVNELRIEKTRLEQEQQELKRLQQLFKLSENYGNYPTTAARVIAKDSGNWFSRFTINKGSADGIAVDMNIISDGGLVGIVTDVGPHYATCRSIIDDQSNVSAMTLKTSDICYVKGDLTQMNEGTIRFIDMANNSNEIPKGETMVTSNISSKYLPGIIIGYVNDIRIDANNLTRSGVLVPAVDFSNFQEVLVITVLKDDLKNTEPSPVTAPDDTSGSGEENTEENAAENTEENAEENAAENAEENAAENAAENAEE